MTGIVGVDAGGTFTDFVARIDGRWQVWKTLSTPQDPALAVVAGVMRLDPAASARVAHGTTVATNALLERRGARTALVVTRGFRDLLALGRGARSELYALIPPAPPELIPAELCFEMDERLDASGAVVRAFTPAEAARVAGQVAASGAESVAVCGLFSYLWDGHERALLEALLACPTAPRHVSLSSEVLPEFREFERASTTAVNAYVAPLMAAYLERLADRAQRRTIHLMGSHGGTMTLAEAARFPVATVLSGPAAGVEGAVAVAARAGRRQLLTLDMGGTSTDVALCDDGVPFSGSSSVGGFPVHRPAVDVHSVGAGGGSIVWLDAGGVLRIGPQSAGARPGPAAYGFGGDRPTVTDAHVALGRLPADRPLAGGLRLDAERAVSALHPLAAALGCTVEEVALGAVAVVEAIMARALRRVSVERGVDPRGMTLVAYGGAGPLHACALADLLGMRAVLVPAYPGALSALGLAVAAPKATATRSVLGRAGSLGALPARELSAGAFKSTWASLSLGASRSLPSSAVDVVVRRSADLRYRGQSWELAVPWPEEGPGASTLEATLEAAFHAAHHRRFGYARPGAAIEVVTLRTEASLPSATDLPPAPPATGESWGGVDLVTGTAQLGTAQLGTAQPVLRQRATCVARGHLVPGEALVGPCVIVQADATTYVPPEWVAVTGPWGDLLLNRR